MFKKLQNIASFAQLQFKSMDKIFNKIANFVTISATVIEILTFNE